MYKILSSNFYGSLCTVRAACGASAVLDPIQRDALVSQHAQVRSGQLARQEGLNHAAEQTREEASRLVLFPTVIL
jgi:hypothetical protein